MELNTKYVAQGAIIAALYAALTVLLSPISYGLVQCRVTEALCILPMFSPAAIWGLSFGCLIANIFGGGGVVDIVFGTLATLLAALCTYRFRKTVLLAPLFPVLFNAIIVGGYLHILTAPPVPLPFTMLYIALGEAVACYALGLPLHSLIKNTALFK
ncbi:MAG: QueT transporter family protein [Clostridia bacterium]|nr:QueT transporter family protein [Clostridia bacterium]